MKRLAAIAFAAFASVASAAPLVTGVYATRNASLGKILISSNGHTLYHSSASCAGACTTTWKPLTVAAGAKPIAGPGVSASLLGSVRRPDGTMQVTYAGKTLYLYSGDSKAGDVRGQGLGGTWHVIRLPGGTSTTTPPPATGSGSSSGSGGSSPGPSGSPPSGSSPGGGDTGAAGNDCAANPGGYGCM